MQYFIHTEFETKAELTKEFRRLSKIHHPDVGGTKEAFQALQNEYEQLEKVVGVTNDDPENNWFQQLTTINLDRVTHCFDDMEYRISIKIPRYLHEKGYQLTLRDMRFGLEITVPVAPYFMGMNSINLFDNFHQLRIIVDSY